MQDTRGRILSVALELFAEKGFEGAGIQEIAERAGVAKSVIYYHFRNKDQVLEQILQMHITAALELKREIGQRYFEGSLGEEELARFVDHLLSYVLANRKAMKVFLLESIKNTERIPLLAFWEANIRAGAGIAREAGAGFDAHAMGDTLLEAFFMLLLPILGYAVLEDKWAKHFALDERGMRRTFEKVFKTNLREFWFDRLRGASGGTIPRKAAAAKARKS
jgi:AcrR family transcriptional regulator